MQNSIVSLIENRRSIGRYNPQKGMSEAEIRELIRLASLSPSAFNMQNWKFIVVHTEEAKQRLHRAAYFQPQILDAAATVIVCADTEGYRQLAQRLQPAVDQGIVAAETATGWANMAAGAHQDNAQLRRDEALRSASLASMTLMLAAEGLGYASGAMSGFDAEALSQAFALEAGELPVMLVALGHAAEGNWSQKPRRPLQDILEIV
ncbi:nitroreductase family protein [Neptuniibacter halophilus]|uniref:nitroreductase family protein n=1 Tax=Neptuniibacter halophilus TaxID=651666 RepID=UPI0025732A60|nr:nitroreductase family protein [Neptuniibacter halophilus]